MTLTTDSGVPRYHYRRSVRSIKTTGTLLAFGLAFGATFCAGYIVGFYRSQSPRDLLLKLNRQVDQLQKSLGATGR